MSRERHHAGTRWGSASPSSDARCRAAGPNSATRPASDAAAEEVRGAIDGVRVSLDELAHTITRTVNDAEVHDAARSAAGGLVEALSASLDDLAGKIQSRKD